MDKKTHLILWGTPVVIAIIAALALWKFFPVPKEKTPDSMQGVVAMETAQTSIADSVGKVNPFSADVNPVGGYVNPFE